jgi:hypothetical protein
MESSQLLYELSYQDVQTLLGFLWCWESILSVIAAQHYPISGVHTAINNQTGARPLIRNINEFQKDIPFWYENERIL